MATTSKTVAGSTTPTGKIRIKSAIKPLAGSSTPSGALATHRTSFKVLAGSLSPIAALVRSVGKNPALAGSTTPVAILVRRTSKKVGQGYTYPNGVIRRSVRKTTTGSITTSGSTSITDFGRVFGYPGVVVMNFVQQATLSIRNRRV